jgi:hypothetical protein
MSTALKQRSAIETTINEGYFFFGSASPNPAGRLPGGKPQKKADEIRRLPCASRCLGD